MPLMDPEGIWEFPDYNVTTVIIRENDRCNTFGIWVVDSENCAVSPGSRLGTLSTSLQSGKYALKIFSSFKKGQLSAPREALATLSVKDEAIFIDKLKIDFTINPLAMIPSFARRMFRLKFNDPIRQIKKGLTKIYPSYDGNGSSRRQPVYL